MTALTIARREMPLDDLVVRVYHLELKECRDEAEFKDAIQLVLRNLDEVMDTLGCLPACQAGGIMRAVDRLKLKAFPYARSFRGLPESFGDPEEWRQAAIDVCRQL